VLNLQNVWLVDYINYIKSLILYVLILSLYKTAKFSASLHIAVALFKCVRLFYFLRCVFTAAFVSFSNQKTDGCGSAQKN